MRTGETLTLPGGTAFTLVRSAEETGGERVEFEIELPPGAPSPPRHLHRRQEESWQVLEGELDVLVDGRWRKLAAGESLTVPAGRVHTLRNRSGATVRVRDVHAPALDFQDYIEDVHRVAVAQGGVSLTRPGSLLRFARVLVEHRTTQVSASPTQRLAETLLAALARLLRLR